MLNSNLWALLTSSHGLQSGPRSQPRAETSVPTAPNPNKLHRTVGFGKFCFLFPHISGVGVFSKTQTHLLTKREKKLGEQGACGQRSDPSSPRAMPGSPSSLLPAPNGCCCSRYLDYLSSIYICICLSPPTRPPPCSSSSFPINARRPAAHNRASLPRPEPLPGAGHQAGPSSWWAEPGNLEATQAPAPPRPSMGRSAHPPALLPPTLETQREERKGET